jgi:hypothetical protein
MDKKLHDFLESSKIKKRITYLESQIAAGPRLDGWSLEGAKKELKKLKTLWKNTFTEEN